MHLLVIEDDPRLSRLLKRLLEDDRHVVEVATDGRSGLEIAEDAPGIEGIILDIGLPDMSGLEVARRLRASGSGVHILMLTARDTVGDRVNGLDAGADDYLVKPFAFEELSARLRALGRRATPAGRRTAPHLVVGPIALDEAARRVTVDGATDRSQSARVLAARVPAAPRRPDADARPAARPGLAVRGRGDPQRGRCLHPLPARQAGRRGAAHRDGPGGRLPAVRCLTARAAPPSQRPHRPSRPTRPACCAASGPTSPCGAAGSPSRCSSSSGSSCTWPSTAPWRRPARPSWWPARAP